MPYNKDNPLFGVKPTIKSKWIKDWTQDWRAGDVHYNGEGSGQGWFPIWNQESDLAGNQLQSQFDKYSNPNSSYYKDIAKQIRSQLTGAMSPDSLLAMTAAMGGSPAQAEAQRKAMEGRITDQTANLTNQLYLNTSGQATSLLGMITQNSQWQEELRHQLEQYNESKNSNFWNNLIKTGIGIGSMFIPGGQVFGATQIASGLGGGSLTPQQRTTINSVSNAGLSLAGY